MLDHLDLEGATISSRASPGASEPSPLALHGAGGVTFRSGPGGALSLVAGEAAIRAQGRLELQSRPEPRCSLALPNPRPAYEGDPEPTPLIQACA